MGRSSFALILVALAAAPASADSDCQSAATCRPLCDKGDAHACGVLGALYTRLPEAGGSKMYSDAGVKLLDKACQKNNAQACSDLARTLTVLQLDDHSIDDKRIADAHKRAQAARGSANDGQAAWEKQCAAGMPRGCRSAASGYGPDPSASTQDDPPPPPEDDGNGTAMALDKGAAKAMLKPDPKKAKQLRDRAAKLVADACAAKHLSTCADNDESSNSLDVACKAGVADDCYQLAHRLASDTHGAWIAPAKRGCELGDFIMCQWLAQSAETGDRGMTKDAAQATAWWSKGCDAHDGDACTALAKAEKTPAKQLALFQRACDENELFGCEQAGDALWKTDAKKALELHTKSCDLEERVPASIRPICNELGARFETGNGVTKDAAKAKALKAQGCKAGEKKSC